MCAFLLPDHWQDVLAGSLLGILMANFTYRQYFRSLASKISHLPYEPRTQRAEGLHEPLPSLPRYHTLHRPTDREDADGEVELINGAGRNGRPTSEPPGPGWERGPSLESGYSHS